jgi:hypothetical protein
VPDSLLDLPAVRVRLAALDALELGFRLVELLACPPRIDVERVHRVVD